MCVGGGGVSEAFWVHARAFGAIFRDPGSSVGLWRPLRAFWGDLEGNFGSIPRAQRPLNLLYLSWGFLGHSESLAESHFMLIKSGAWGCLSEGSLTGESGGVHLASLICNVEPESVSFWTPFKFYNR